MKLSDYIEEDLVFVIHEPADKHSFLQELVACAGDHLAGIDKQELLSRLCEREEQVSTGIGHGVAIPHAIVEGIESMRCVIAQTPEGLDYLALDTSPVSITFLLLSPPGKAGEHIRLLARIARLASNEVFISRLTKAKDAQEIYALTLEEDGRHV